MCPDSIARHSVSRPWVSPQVVGSCGALHTAPHTALTSAPCTTQQSALLPTTGMLFLTTSMLFPPTSVLFPTSSMLFPTTSCGEVAVPDNWHAVPTD